MAVEVTLVILPVAGGLLIDAAGSATHSGAYATVTDWPQNERPTRRCLVIGATQRFRLQPLLDCPTTPVGRCIIRN